jgi:hypothetical protein
LHDVTATLRALPRAPDAVVLSGSRAPDQSTGGNAEELANLGITQVLEVVAAGARDCPATVRRLLSDPTYKSGN